MNAENKYYNPFIPFAISKRERKPGELYNPFVDLKKAEPDSSGIKYLSPLVEPCNPNEDPMYVVHPQQIAPPQGFCPINLRDSFPKRPIVEDYGSQTLAEWGENVNGLAVQHAEYIGQSFPELLHTSQGETKEQREEMEDITRGRDGYYVSVGNRTASRRVTNWYVEDIETIHSRKFNNTRVVEERRIAFDLVVFPENGGSPNKRRIEIKYEDFDKIVSIVQKKEASAVIYRHAAPFEVRLIIELRRKMSSCTHRYEFLTSGWVNLPNGQKAYVQDGVKPPVDFVTYHSKFSFYNGGLRRAKEEIVRSGLGVLRISRDPAVMAIMFLWALLGLLFSLFEEAGFRPSSVLFIDGVTGSMKTSVSRLIFGFSGKDGGCDDYATFRDTSSSMEVLLGRCRDRVLLVDDFCPPADGHSTSTARQSLERLIRYFGDGKARGRTTPQLEEVTEKKVNCTCVITGEDTAGSLSSLLRCLFLPVEKTTFDGEVLAQYQEQPWLWTEFLQLFTEYIAPRYDEVVKMIRQQFPELRKAAAGELQERRLADTSASLMMVSRLVLDMYADMGYTGGEEYERFFRQAILKTCKDSERRALESNPSCIFAKSLLTMLHTETVVLGSVELFAADPKRYIGAEKDGYWYLWPDRTYSAVRQFYQDSGKVFPLGDAALWRQLAADGALLPTHTKKKGVEAVEYGTKVSFAGRPRLLKFDPQKLQALAEDEA